MRKHRYPDGGECRNSCGVRRNFSDCNSCSTIGWDSSYDPYVMKSTKGSGGHQVIHNPEVNLERRYQTNDSEPVISVRKEIVFKCKCGVECATDDELKDHICNQVSMSKECVVCLDAPSTVLLNPCGHAQFCGKCASVLKICPVCRSNVLSVIKVFM